MTTDTTMSAQYTMVDAIAGALAHMFANDGAAVLISPDLDRLTAASSVFESFCSDNDDRIVDTSAGPAATLAVAAGAVLSGRRVTVDLGPVDRIVGQLGELSATVADLAAHLDQRPAPLTALATIDCDELVTPLAHVAGSLVRVPIVMPSNPTDAYGLMAAALTADEPVVFVHDSRLDAMTAPADPDGPQVPLGVASLLQPGRDVTLVGAGAMIGACLGAASLVSADGIDVEIIDLRTIAPVDTSAIIDSVARTNHCVVVEAGLGPGGVGAEVAALVQEHAFDHLDAPVARVGIRGERRPGPDAHMIAAQLRDTTARIG